MIIYGIKNCDTMKKAFQWLKDHGVDYTFHDYKTQGIAAGKLTEWLQQTDMQVLLNTKGTTFKKLSDAEKASISDQEKAIALMIGNPSMIKRPVLEAPNGLLVGFSPAAWEEKLLK